MSGSVKCELIAAEALRSWLLNQLPAKVTAVNAERAPVLQTPTSGPFDIPPGAFVHVSTKAIEYSQEPNDFAKVPLTTGSGRTPADLAADFNAAVDGLASVDPVLGVLQLTGGAPSGTSTNGAIVVAPDETGANVALGWAAGGERRVRSPLVAPTPSGLCDGLPSMGPPPEYGGGMWIVLGDRTSKGVLPEVRRDEYRVMFDVDVLSFRLPGEGYREREHIASCVRCVREVLLTQAGRQLGRASQGDIMLVELAAGARISATSFNFAKPVGSPLFDGATMSISVKVFERPASS